MNKYTCPHCGVTFVTDSRTWKREYVDKKAGHLTDFTASGYFDVLLCPSCDKLSIEFCGCEKYMNNLSLRVFPFGDYQTFPDYVPEAIRNDYREAATIQTFSPKASATLLRRCLQGMIRDFWKISKKRLVDEVEALKNVVPAAQWSAIDAVRKIGNIGAHMESDVNLIIDVKPKEVEQLKHLVELLIRNWYITRHDEEILFKSVADISKNKEQERKSKPDSK